jgi:hypothetical protein
MPCTFRSGSIRVPCRDSRYWIFLSLTCAAWLACAPGEEAGGSAPDSDAVSVVDSSGVEIVTNRGDGWGAGEAWRLEPDLQVGERDGPAAFGRISWVAPGPPGAMVVLDAQSHRVHVFDSAGVEIGRFGREGDGPGEFRAPAVVTPLADGRLTVAQGFPPVLQWVTAEGEYLGSTRIPITRDEAGSPTAGAIAIWQVTSAGRVFTQVQIIDPTAADGEMPVALLEIDPTGDALPDTIANWTWNAGLRSGEIRVFEAVHSWMPRSDGVVLLSPGAPYEIQWHDPSSGLQRVMRRPLRAPAVTDRHRLLAIDEMRTGMADGGAPRAAIDELLRKVVFGSTVPDVLRIWVSEPDGRLWVGVHDAGLFENQEDRPNGDWVNALDVFGREGLYLGRIPIPQHFTLRVVTEDALYGIWKDELEVPFARRYRVVKPQP